MARPIFFFWCEARFLLFRAIWIPKILLNTTFHNRSSQLPWRGWRKIQKQSSFCEECLRKGKLLGMKPLRMFGYSHQCFRSTSYKIFARVTATCKKSSHMMVSIQLLFTTSTSCFTPFTDSPTIFFVIDACRQWYCTFRPKMPHRWHPQEADAFRHCKKLWRSRWSWRRGTLGRFNIQTAIFDLLLGGAWYHH